MRYLSVCSGIEAATAAWHPMGWQPAAFAEIDKFPSAVLAKRWPGVRNLGDFTKIEARDVGAIDVLVGGTPCQSFSVAGLRGGLDDDRGNLALEFCRLAKRTRPRWVLWENVPGVRSLDGGEAFASILGGLVECGYHLAFRELDAQYFGLAQRRKRVFVVGYLGDWRPPAAVLFERESLSWNPPPRREARKDVAPTISARPTGGGGLGTDFDLDGGLTPIQSVQAVRDKKQNGIGIGQDGDPMFTLTGRDQHAIAFDNTGQGYWSNSDAASTLGSHAGRSQYESTLIANCLNAKGGSGRMDAGSETLVAATLTACYAKNGGAGGGKDSLPHNLIAFSCKDHGADAADDIAPTLRAMGHAESHANAGGQIAINSTYGVRRLTPRECERLMGFPDDFTRIADKTADGPRYKALGNSMAVPVMRWIGERIAAVDAIKAAQECRP